ncbi:MAG: DUF1800 domain-containing protein [Roseateles sp.]|nr:MAG: DUF1800 domain-containing protein [Roseateles sp.]
MTPRRFFLASGALLGSGLLLTRHARAEQPAPLSAEERALHALNRLAYGPRPQDLQDIATQGAEAWLERFLGEQLQPGRLPAPAALQTRLAGLELLTLSPNELLHRERALRQARRTQRRSEAQAEARSEGQVMPERAALRELQRQAGVARLLRAREQPAQLVEVLTEFWFNHFNVFAGKAPVGLLVADYEQRAIRPHVLGRFRDMLGATARHPAMLIYLDNARNAATGRPGTRGGLNENYARELMELHTLGVDGGYTQQDVTELARVLTGWGLDARAIAAGTPGDGFRFDPRRHDAGGKTWLGRRIAPAGQAEGEQALDLLARHPATARHLAYRFAQALVADQPPPALVQRLADDFLRSDGDLHQLTRTLLRADEFWQRGTVRAKFKTPWRYLVSSLRALDLPVDAPQPLLAGLAQAGQPLYGAASPEGYKTTAEAWRNAEALTQRVQLAASLGARSTLDPEQLAPLLGGAPGLATRQVLAGQPPARQRALLLASPDFLMY